MKPVVIKRDGCRVPFNGMRIIEAVAKSAEAVGIKDLAYCASIAEQITQQLAGRDEVAIHDIQNMVENLLMAGERKEMARAYIEYRHDRDMAREKQGRLSQEIRGLIEQSNADLLNENANKDSKVIPTRMPSRRPRRQPRPRRNRKRRPTTRSPPRRSRNTMISRTTSRGPLSG